VGKLPVTNYTVKNFTVFTIFEIILTNKLISILA
jgi:hypothetical protein